MKLAALFFLIFPFLLAAQHSVTLSWTAGDTNTTPLDGYNIYKATSSCSGTPTFTKLASVSPAALCTTAAPCSYQDLAVIAGTTYCYALTATNSGLESGKSPFANAVIPTFFPPGVPATFTAAAQ
jgi:hypothetical protein